MSRALLRNARIPGPLGASESVDILIKDGLIDDVRPTSASAPEGAVDADRVIDTDGRYVVPGLWDNHVHMNQWALARQRVDVSGATSAETLVASVAAVAAQRRAQGAPILIGYGFRDGLWPDVPTPQLLDTVTADLPTVMVSGDLHSAWLNSAALRRFGGTDHPTGMLREAELFAIMAGLSDQPEEILDGWVREAASAAAARGVVGIVDFEMPDCAPVWERRIAAGCDSLRVICSVWTDALESAIGRGRRSGEPVPGTGGLAITGPLKVITDGSLNTRTAYCDDPYPVARVEATGGNGGAGAGHGILSVPYEDLVAAMTRAWSAGIGSAIHAIGDRANRLALDAFERVGCPGSIEHAQLLHRDDAHRMARLGVIASVQPEHAMDDRDVAEIHWAGRTSRAFTFRTMLAAGVGLALGSDAPVAPLDPWIAMSAAVFRSRDGRPSWYPDERIDVVDALAASTNGVLSVRAGGVADLVVVEQDPYAADADQLREMPVWATFLGGRQTFGSS